MSVHGDWSWSLKQRARMVFGAWRAAGRRKVFCLGRNKTGTTSLAAALRSLGLVVGLQAPAEKLFPDWVRRDYRRIIRFCRTAQAFQDIPFNLPGMYAVLDCCFPGSRFVLTVRESSESWVESYLRWQIKIYGQGTLPTADLLKSSPYCYPGFAYETKKYVYQTPDDDLYNRQQLIEHYERYNQNVREYFARKPEDLLVLNVGEPGAYRRLSEFLGVPPREADFPWENRTPPAE
jgi:hypothetical protein